MTLNSIVFLIVGNGIFLEEPDEALSWGQR